MTAPTPRRHRIITIVGTRPEAIKMAPVVRALNERPSLDQQILLTGQHRDLGRKFDFMHPRFVHDLNVDMREQTAGEICDAVWEKGYSWLGGQPADLLIVQGDTASALGGALAAYDRGLPIAHVEAGLRSFDLQQPWPEEGNRMAIDALANLLFAPTQLAARNLERDRDVTGSIHVTGNSGIDALLFVRDRLPLPARGDGNRKKILVTCHRRENRGRRFAAICQTLKRLISEFQVEILFPLHPNHDRSAVAQFIGDEPHITLLQPVEYEEMVALMVQSWLILTDSGGLQEEGPALGKPVLVLRNVTERPEAIATAYVELIGTMPDQIYGAVARLLRDSKAYARMSRPNFPFGDGSAAPRIANIIEHWLEKRAEQARGSLKRPVVEELRFP